MRPLLAFLVVASIACASPAHAALGDCSQPVSSGTLPTASDCLFILGGAVGLQTCSPECICDPTGEGTISASDALLCLANAVGQSSTLECPCGAAEDRVFFASSRDQFGNDIYSMNPDGSDLQRLTTSSLSESHPAVSADGSRVVFVRGNSNATELWTMNADGSNQQQITNEALDVESPCWSPDGTKIVYSAEISSFDWDIKVVNADGSNPVTIVSGTQFDKDPDWSPDGTKIAFLSNRAAGDGIYVMNADGSGQTGIMTGDTNDTAPSWSPDGSKIVFVSQRDGKKQIYVMNANGSGAQRLTNNDAVADDGPKFSPDGSKIVFSSRREDITQDIFVMNADGSGEVQITDVDANDLHPDW